jgi:hypothetical protein
MPFDYHIMFVYKIELGLGLEGMWEVVGKFFGGGSNGHLIGQNLLI